MEGAHLFLGGFKHVSEGDVRSLCEGFGTLQQLKMKGTFAFAYFKEYQDCCTAAEQLDGIVWKGCKLAARIQGAGTGRAQPPAAPDMDNDDGTTLFLGGLSALAGEAAIRQVCAPYGEVVSVILKTGGYGFVRFATPEQAMHAAVSLHRQQILTNTKLTARVQTSNNRARSTGVRDVGAHGTMLPKFSPAPPKEVVPNFPIIISGFQDTPLEDIEAAVRELCWNYGEVLSLDVFPGQAQVLFVEPGVSDRMGVEFANGSDWNGKELSMEVDKTPRPIKQEVVQPATPRQVSARNCLEVRGFPMNSTQDEIRQACFDLFDAFLQPGEQVKTNPKIGCCAVIFPTEQQAHQAAVHYSTGALWGDVTLTVVEQGGSGSCLGTGRLGAKVTKRDLSVLFGLFGTVTKVTIDGERCGFVDFLESDASAKARQQADGHELDGVKMNIKILDPRKPKPTRSNPAPQRYAPY